jgi:chorismate dehydratase
MPKPSPPTQSPRISASSYSNTAPLIWSFLYGQNRGRFEMILDTAPARSAELLAQKRVDAALVPVIAYQTIEDARLVPDVCVGAREKVRSVCLVTKGEDLKNVRNVALDVSSKTSVALAKIIFREFIGREPQWKISKPDLEKMLAESDCALLIGDPALVIDERVYRKFDLAETWKSFTGCGFVFAMWMASAEKAGIARKIELAAARDEGLRHLDEIISNYETEIPLRREDFKEYLAENISYSIDESMRKGLELYFRLAHENGLIDNHKPLSFI